MDRPLTPSPKASIETIAPFVKMASPSPSMADVSPGTSRKLSPTAMGAAIARKISQGSMGVRGFGSDFARQSMRQGPMFKVEMVLLMFE